MLFNLQIAAVLAMSVARIQAFPTADAVPVVGSIEDGMRIEQVEQREDGTLVWYSDPTDVTPVDTVPAANDALMSRQVCSNTIASCNGEAGGSHLAKPAICSELINNIGSNSNTLKGSPRSICKSATGQGRCCVSWNKKPSNPRGPTSQLANPANAIFKECYRGIKVSGRNTSAQVGGQCMTVCLSNRPKGCK
jgi:hypothetical protein